MRGYCKLHPPLGSKNRSKNSPSCNLANDILSKTSKFIPDFTTPENLRLNKSKIARFPPNPGRYNYNKVYY